MTILSNNIKLLRLKDSWKQEEVAEKLQISIPTYSKIENGLSDMNLQRLRRFAEVFNVPIFALLSADNIYLQQLEELDTLRIRLAEKTVELLKLQAKLIELYEVVMEQVLMKNKQCEGWPVIFLLLWIPV